MRLTDFTVELPVNDAHGHTWLTYRARITAVWPLANLGYPEPEPEPIGWIVRVQKPDPEAGEWAKLPCVLPTADDAELLAHKVLETVARYNRKSEQRRRSLDQTILDLCADHPALDEVKHADRGQARIDGNAVWPHRAPAAGWLTSR